MFTMLLFLLLIREHMHIGHIFLLTRGVVPPADGDGDVYMNETSTNQAYTDLDPINMTMDNVYSSLSWTGGGREGGDVQ